MHHLPGCLLLKTSVFLVIWHQGKKESHGKVYSLYYTPFLKTVKIPSFIISDNSVQNLNHYFSVPYRPRHLRGIRRIRACPGNRLVQDLSAVKSFTGHHFEVIYFITDQGVKFRVGFFQLFNPLQP